MLISLTFGWIVVFVDLGQTTFAAVVGVVGAWSEYSRRRHADLVEYFVTDRRIVVHSDEEGKFDERVYRLGELGEPEIEAHADGTGTISFPDGPTLRAIDHAQRVFEHVQRARRSAEGTSAE